MSDGLHRRADLWRPMRGPIVPQQKDRSIFSFFFSNITASAAAELNVYTHCLPTLRMNDAFRKI